MVWKYLIIAANGRLILPWVGTQILRKDERTWFLVGNRPQEHGWGRFLCKNTRSAFYEGTADPHPEQLKYVVEGYLVGNRLVQHEVRVNPDPLKIAEQTEEVFLIDPGIDRFAHVSAGRMFEEGPLIFKSREFPLGSEVDVLNAFLNNEQSVDNIKGVIPALDAAFRMEVWQRAEAQRRRLELEKRRREEEEKLAREAIRDELLRKLGDGSTRREMAKYDFEAAARAALAVGGATYLDHRKSVRKHEMVVRFRLKNRRFECICDDRTLGIIDSGICLNAHYDDKDFEVGTKGDTWFTLESLPVVILQAQKENKLVVFRHVDMET